VVDARSFQAGLSWRTILHKRKHFFRPFDGWEPEIIAAYGPEKIAELLNDPGIVRNRMKVNGAVQNAQAFLNVAAASHLPRALGNPPALTTRRRCRVSGIAKRGLSSTDVVSIARLRRSTYRLRNSERRNYV
jgi:hypothetical protein